MHFMRLSGRFLGDLTMLETVSELGKSKHSKNLHLIQEVVLIGAMNALGFSPQISAFAFVVTDWEHLLQAGMTSSGCQTLIS